MTNPPPPSAGPGLKLARPVLQTNAVLLSLVEANTNLAYELFVRPGLEAGAAWSHLIGGVVGQTNFTTPRPGFARAFYLAAQILDSDGDGLTDAQEHLVLRTDPADPDTDDDGMPDGWEVRNELNPLLNDATEDPDGDWLTNLQEYQGGTDPTDSMVLAWGNSPGAESVVPLGLRQVASLAGGMSHSLARQSSGSVIAWGDNTHGQTNVPAGLTNTVSLAAGLSHGLAARSNGTVVAWGSWWEGPFQPVSVPSGLTNITSVAAGENHALALRANGTVVAWGYTNTSYTTVPPGLSGVKAIAAGWEHSVALLTNGTVVAWGENGTSVGWNLTSVPAGLGNVIAISAGAYHTLALKADGTVVAWGAGNGHDTLYSLGQSLVPPGLSNVVAISAGGSHSLALKADGTVVAWGDLALPAFPLTGITVLGSGANHALALRTGRLTPLISRQPGGRAAPAGTDVTFTAQGLGLAGVRYQWQRDGVNIAGATNATLTLNNVGAADTASYQVIISTGAGSITNDTASFTLVRPPQILAITPAAGPGTTWLWGTAGLSVSATAEALDLCPLTYRWSKNGVVNTNQTGPGCLSGVNAENAPSTEGDYTVTVANVAGVTNIGPWRVRAAVEGMVLVWGANESGQQNRPLTLTNALALGAGEAHSVVVKDDGTVQAWGANSYGQTNVPPGLTNGLAAAAGAAHSLVLKSDVRVIAWGRNDFGQTNVPTNLTNAIAISAGGHQSLALKKDGKVTQWGQTNGTVPTSLTNAIAIASGTNFHLALRKTGTVVAWGNNLNGQTNVPANLTNAVAIAAGGAHALALRSDGTLTAWGSNGSGEGTIPAALRLTNIMAIAAGTSHNLALRNDGTLAAWGDNSVGQTNTAGLSEVKLIAAGGRQSLASRFSPLVQYPVDMSKDVLLLYNSNPASTNSRFVKDYYLAHRPLAANANVLGVNCPVGEFIGTNQFASQILGGLTNWFNANPTKHPTYLILVYDIPSRLTVGEWSENYQGSVSYLLRDRLPGIKPFITHINMGTTNDCRAYIDKLEFIGTNYSPGRVILSASLGGYGNTNYLLDGIRHGAGYGLLDETDFSNVVANAAVGLASSGVPTEAVRYYDGLETITNGVPYNLAHPSSATNLAGYMCWGAHSSLGGDYAFYSSILRWRGNSRWWIIQTVESFNGQRVTSQGNFIKWFSATAFGVANYSNTPVGAVTHVEEPKLPYINDPKIYFGLWAGGKSFAIAAWQSRRTPWFQAVGDPLTSR